MNIVVLLPYKENFSNKNAGAVSIFVNSTNKLSKFKNNINVYGFTEDKVVFNNYTNIKLHKKIFHSTSSQYLNNFIKLINKKKLDILEIHNRPHYIKKLKLINCKKILYFHNDPLKMQGSITKQERQFIYENTDKIIFNSNWSKSRFLINLEQFKNSNNLEIVHQSTSKKKIYLKKKKKIISYIGKLNSSKGYDIFGEAILRILDKYNDWSCIVIGDEPRQKHFFSHKNLNHLGFKTNSFILKKLETVSIAVIPSKWDEPFGRSSMEAASRGCAVIKSNTGGLNETTQHSITLNTITPENIFNKIEYLIKNKKIRTSLQHKAYKNFNLTNKNASIKLDKIRDSLIEKKFNINLNRKKNLKILHITNFNERFNGRLHYNTGKRLNNGLIRNGFNVLNISDRDIISNYKKISDLNGVKTLNNKIISTFNNFNPDIILMGHADNVSLETLDFIKNKKKSLKIGQWFLDPVSKNGPDYKINKNRFLKFNKYLDANFITTDPHSLDFNTVNTFYMPNPSDKAFETLNNYKFNCDNDLFFAMSHGVHRGILKGGKHDDREKILNLLVKKNKNIKFDLYGFNNKQPIWGDQFISAISNSKMGLNLSRGKPVKYYSSDRIAQLMGNGLLTFIDEKTCFSDFFSKNEIITYKNLNDLNEKINKFKKDDRQRRQIAKNGKDKYLKHFNSDKVSKFIINKILDIDNKEKFIWN
jgi:glycosyltransferase involved in cell wall biosynthesis